MTGGLRGVRRGENRVGGETRHLVIERLHLMLRPLGPVRGFGRIDTYLCMQVTSSACTLAFAHHTKAYAQCSLVYSVNGPVDNVRLADNRGMGGAHRDVLSGAVCLPACAHAHTQTQTYMTSSSCSKKLHLVSSSFCCASMDRTS